jgi:hypothetical protein
LRRAAWPGAGVVSFRCVMVEVVVPVAVAIQIVSVAVV